MKCSTFGNPGITRKMSIVATTRPVNSSSAERFLIGAGHIPVPEQPSAPYGGEREVLAPV
jgi:hypothetical protein